MDTQTQQQNIEIEYDEPAPINTADELFSALGIDVSDIHRQAEALVTSAAYPEVLASLQNSETSRHLARWIARRTTQELVDNPSGRANTLMAVSEYALIAIATVVAAYTTPESKDDFIRGFLRFAERMLPKLIDEKHTTQAELLELLTKGVPTNAR